MRLGILILVASILVLQAQSLEDKARAKFESEGAVNMTQSELILLCHEYKRDADWHLRQGLAFKFRVGQLESVVQNMTNELMAVQWHRDKIKEMKDEEAKLSAAILALKGEVNELQRKSDDLRRLSKLGRVSL
jgi:predicted RNase H-like nuclease (RuvC/YqgF family)